MNKVKSNFTLLRAIYVINYFWTRTICADPMKFEYFEWPLQIFTAGNEADRLDNRCTTYVNYECGGAATLIAPSDTTPNTIIGDKLAGTDGFKLDSGDIFSSTWRTTSFTLMLSFKILEFGAGNIYILKSDENLKVGDVWCADSTHKLWVTYFPKDKDIVIYETDYTCLSGKWTNLIFSVNECLPLDEILVGPPLRCLDISARSLEDPGSTFNQNTHGDGEEIGIQRVVNKYLEFGKNFNGFIHNIAIYVGSADIGSTLFWRTMNGDYEYCDSGCTHSMACIGFTDAYPDNQCLQATTDFEYCTIFDEIIGCTECLHPSVLQPDGTCLCSFTISGVIPNRVCGCAPGLYTKPNGDCVSCGDGWSCEICASETDCKTCNISQVGVAEALPCGCDTAREFYEKTSGSCSCKDRFWNVNGNCLSCGWSCETCASASRCGSCKVGLPHLIQTTPCECDVTNGFAHLGGEECTKCNKGTFAATEYCHNCTVVTKNCAECSDSNTCTACLDGYFLLDNICKNCSANACTQCLDASTCTVCMNGYWLVDNICKTCNDIFLCVSCSDLQTCTQCAENAEIINGNCACKDGYVLEEKACKGQYSIIMTEESKDDDEDEDGNKTRNILIIVCVVGGSATIAIFFWMLAMRRKKKFCWKKVRNIYIYIYRREKDKHKLFQ